MRVNEIQSRMAAMMAALNATNAAPTSAAGATTAVGSPAVSGSASADFAKVLEAAMPTPEQKWTSPVPGAVVTSPFGPRWGTQHQGIDLAAQTGQPVAAA